MIKKEKLPCCKRIQAIMTGKSNSLIDYDNIPVYYSSSIRAFFILLCSKKKEHRGGNINAGYRIKFCPWCGKKFPKDLANEKSEILITEHKHESPCSLDDSCFPEEFKTDEWWKKRGL
jgi:uncharacterized protein DUF6980